MALVLVVDRDGTAEEHGLRGNISIGRAADNDIVLAGATASRHHARIEPRDGGCWVLDLGSANGTQLNDAQLDPRVPAALKAGDTLAIGGLVMTVHEAVTAPSPTVVAGLPGLVAEAGAVPITEHATANPPDEHSLVVVTHAGRQSFPLTGAVVALGRDLRNDIAIDDTAVSARHAVLIRTSSGAYVIEDQGSTNGLYVQGRRVFSHDLESGDVIEMSPGVSLEYQRVRIASPGQEPAARVVAAEAGREIVIGRDPSCDLPCDHPMLSRRHCRIGGPTDAARYVEDLGSTNGTFVNGRRLTPRVAHPLRAGDTLMCGPLAFAFGGGGIAQAAGSEAIALRAVGLHQVVGKGVDLLRDISFTIQPAEFVAVVGISGAGKSTLLGALSGFRPASGGTVLINGRDLYRNFDAFRTTLGFVPQEDILHKELPVERALGYAAELRLPEDTTAAERRARVDQVLAILGLRDQAGMEIARLSGGQRKRVSIGAELLTNPGLFFLDEATSGLDPSMEGQLMRLLRRLADDGHTVLLVTHATKNVMLCDKVVFLARGGYLAFFGPPEDALTYFDVGDFDSIYEKLDEGTGSDWDAKYRDSEASRSARALDETDDAGAPIEAPGLAAATAQRAAQRHRPAGARQFGVLSRRYLEIIRRDRATMLILLLSAPLAGMLNFFAWPSNVLDFNKGDANRALIMAFMLTLIGTMVGTISPVREIVKERAIYLRERTVCLRLVPYIASKVWVWGLLCLWGAGVITILTIVALELPGAGPAEYLKLFVSLALTLFSAVLLGLLVSALAPREEQSLLLVIAVVLIEIIFSGGVLPLGDMGVAGSAIGAVTSMNWGFRAVVASFGLTAHGCPADCGLPGFGTFRSDEARQAAFQPVNDRYGDVLGADIYIAWAAMVALIAVYFVALWVIQKRKDVV